jgi:hypothetical protein
MNMRNALITRLGLPTALGAILALALALVAGLGGVGGSSVSSGMPDLVSPDVGKEMGAGGAAPQFGDTVSSDSYLRDGTRDVVRYGSISLEVEDADDALERVTAIAERVGGYITSSSRSGEGENLYLSATLRVPVAEFSSVMAALRDEGEILYEDIGSYEVTLAVLDLEARLENLRASEDAFLALLDRAESVADVVAVQSELSRIQGDIESYEAQLNGMKDQVEMASITVSLSLPVSPVEVATGEFDLAYELSNALANLINVGRAVIVALINILVIGAPIALLGGLFGSLIGRAARMLASRVSRMFGGTSKGTRRVARR